MIIFYKPYAPTIKTDVCSICFEGLDKSKVVAHNNDGEKHPLHLQCIKNAVAAGITKCPSCRVEFDKNSLFTWQEKCVTELKCVKKDAIYGMTIALIFTTSIAILTVLKEANIPVLAAPLVALKIMNPISRRISERTTTGTATIGAFVGAVVISAIEAMRNASKVHRTAILIKMMLTITTGAVTGGIFERRFVLLSKKLLSC